jgi:hypothetical protein
MSNNIFNITEDSIVNFGKYKYKSVKELMRDKEYVEWFRNNIGNKTAYFRNLLNFINNYKSFSVTKIAKFITQSEKMTGQILHNFFPYFVNKKYFDPDGNNDEYFTSIQDLGICQKLISTIRKMHKINAMITGCWVDFLIRRIISQRHSIPLNDNCADKLYALRLISDFNSQFDHTEAEIHTESQSNNIYYDIPVVYISPNNQIKLMKIECLENFVHHYNQTTNTLDFPSEDISYSIFICSLSSRVLSSNFDIPEYDIKKLSTMIKMIEKKSILTLISAIDKLITNTNKISFDEKIKYQNISGIYDLLFDDRLIEIKAINMSDKNKRYTIVQLLIYASMLCQLPDEYVVSSLNIINLLTNKLYTIGPITIYQKDSKRFLDHISTLYDQNLYITVADTSTINTTDNNNDNNHLIESHAVLDKKNASLICLMIGCIIIIIAISGFVISIILSLNTYE